MYFLNISLGRFFLNISNNMQAVDHFMDLPPLQNDSGSSSDSESYSDDDIELMNLTSISDPPEPEELIMPGSPMIHGMDCPTDTEPFPDFDDPCPPVKEEPPHCTLHCNQLVCCWIHVHQPGPLPCPCQNKPSGSLSTSSQLTQGCGIMDLKPIIDFGKDYTKLPSHTLVVNSDDEIVSLDSTDAYELIAKYVETLNYGAMHSFEIDKTLGFKAAKTMREVFHLLMQTYIRRRAHTGELHLTIDQLDKELRIYAITAIADWGKTFQGDVDKPVLGNDFRFYFDDVRGDIPIIVANFFEQCMVDILMLMVWRTKEVASFRKDMKSLAKSASLFCGVVTGAVIWSMFG